MTGQDSPKPDEFEHAGNGHEPVRSDIEFSSDPIAESPAAAFHVDEVFPVDVDDSPDDGDWQSTMNSDIGRTGRLNPEAGGRGRNSRRRPAHRSRPRGAKTPPTRQKVALSPHTMAADPYHSKSPARLSHEFAFMEALAAVAAKTRKASSAGQLAAAMVPLAMQSVSRYQAELQPVVPVLVWGASGVAELMHAEETPVLIELMPAILYQTVQRLGSLVALGQPVDRRVATDVLAEFTSTIIEQNYGDDRGPRRTGQVQWDGEDEYDNC